MGNYECLICGEMIVKGFKPEECKACGSNSFRKVSLKDRKELLYLRLDQAYELLDACRSLKEKLAVKYFMLNGLSPMELANARIEHLDPVNCELFLPRRHWKSNCVTDIDAETVRLQIVYAGDRKKGPLLISYKTKGHFTERGLWALIKRIAVRTNIPNKELITPLILKRTYARIFLKTPGNTVSGLQKSFSHKHLWSTAHYLRFVLDDVKIEKTRMMKKFNHTKEVIKQNEQRRNCGSDY